MFDLSKSPIRENVSSLEEGQLSIFEDDDLSGETGENYRKLQAKTILKDVENMLGAVENHQDEAVRIAVMGEVKAGKSTFVNACVGKEVAYTDILEATAIVSEITYSEKEYAHIYAGEETVVKDFSIDELLEWTEEQLEEEADFSCFSKIKIGVNNEFLRNIIFVDTPGLLSIKSTNHDITNKYVAQTDYILWVLNSRDLGSKAVNDYLDKIMLSGKPIIGIINKVDSYEERREIEQQIEKEYGGRFEEIFYTSSANAWEQRSSGDPEWAEDTGFLDVMECIETLGADKEQSTERTQFYQLQRDREVHIRLKERIEKRKEYYDGEISRFARINAMMKDTISSQLDDWVEADLYRDEKMELMNAEGEVYQNLFDQYSSAAYLTDVVDQKYQEITSFIYKQWEVIENGLTSNASGVLIDFCYDNPSNWEGQGANVQKALQGDAKKWAKAGAAVGMTFAGYAAWLGPAASIVTFPAALPAAIPLGLGIGVLGYLSDRNKAGVEKAGQIARKKQAEVDGLYQAVRKSIMAKKLELRNALWACTDYYYEERENLYREKTGLLHFDFTEPYYGTFLSRLNEYIVDLDREIARLEDADLPAPPSTEDLEDQ